MPSKRTNEPQSTKRPIRPRDYEKALERARTAEAVTEQFRAQRDEAIAAQRKAKETLETDKHELSTRPDLTVLLGRIVTLNSKWNLKALKGAVDCLDLNQGCTTPVEDFIETILYEYAGDDFLTPDDVDRALEKFREDYGDMVKCGTRFAHHHERILAVRAAHEVSNSDKQTAAQA